MLGAGARDAAAAPSKPPEIHVSVNLSDSPAFQSRMQEELNNPPDVGVAMAAPVVALLNAKLPVYRFSETMPSSQGHELSIVLYSVPVPWPAGDLRANIQVATGSGPPTPLTEKPIPVLDRAGPSLEAQAAALKTMSWLTSAIQPFVDDEELAHLLSQIPIEAPNTTAVAGGRPVIRSRVTYQDLRIPLALGHAVFAVRWMDGTQGQVEIPFVTCYGSTVAGPVIKTEADRRCPPTAFGSLPAGAPPSWSQIYLLHYRSSP